MSFLNAFFTVALAMWRLLLLLSTSTIHLQHISFDCVYTFVINSTLKLSRLFFGVSAEIKRVIQIHRGRKFAFRSEKKEVLRLHTFATRLHENSKNTAQTRSEQKLVIQIGRLFFCSAFATHYVFICVQIISYYISFSFSYALRFFFVSLAFCAFSFTCLIRFSWNRFVDV